MCVKNWIGTLLAELGGVSNRLWSDLIHGCYVPVTDDLRLSGVRIEHY